MTRGGERFPAGLTLLVLLLSITLAGCTESTGGDAAASANAASAGTNPPVASVKENHGDGAVTGSEAAATGPGAEADTANPEDSASNPEPVEEPASRMPDATGDVSPSADTNTAAAAEDNPEEPLPFLIDLGANKCIPCKMMAPILEELAKTKKDYFEVIFYDVWEDRSKGQEFGIRAIPTQIFFSAQGEELFRHEGYFSRRQILDKWRDLGIDVGE